VKGYPVKKYLNKDFLKDLVDRTASTYVQSFLMLEVSDVTNVMSLSGTKAAALAALPAALAVAKAAFVRARSVKKNG
jgi:hypothetical protein